MIFAFLFAKKWNTAKKTNTLFKCWSLLTAAILWFGYGFYEHYMQIKYPPECVPIRVDMLLITPILYFITIYALVVFLKRR